jgi:hypothetical protein
MGGAGVGLGAWQYQIQPVQHLSIFVKSYSKALDL